MNRDIPTVSVVIPAYNAEKTIGYTLDSVLQQTFEDFEIVIVNDCSSDGTAKVTKDYSEKDSRIRVLNNSENLGVAVSRRKGAEAARSDRIAFLDSDDLWRPEKLEKQLKTFFEKSAGLVFTGSAFIGENGEKLDWILHVPEKIGFKELLKQNLISNSSVLIGREDFLRYSVTGNDIHEDYACWLNYLREEGNVAYGIDEPLLVYRLSRGSRSGNKLRSAAMNLNTYRSVGIRPLPAAYYMLCYAVNGILKYRNLR